MNMGQGVRLFEIMGDYGIYMGRAKMNMGQGVRLWEILWDKYGTRWG
jgi:predicted RNA-binding protein